MRILVLGAAGMLGGKLLSTLGPRHEIVCASRSGDPGLGWFACDVTDAAAVAALLDEVAPDVCINAAAFTAVDRCETEEETATAVNGRAPGLIATAAGQRGIRLVHFSTDYVFSGDAEGLYGEDDEPAPRTAYGRSKLAGERAVMDSGADWLIARVQWLYGEGGGNFPETILRLSGERPSLQVVDDQWGCPTYTGDVARQIGLLVEAGAEGLFHVVDRGVTTWWGFARRLLDRVGRADYPIERVTTEAFPRPAPRPRNSALDNRRLRRTVGDTMRPWQDALDEYLELR